MDLRTELLAVLNKELRPALGCTEPAAVGLAAAYAAKAVGGKILTIKVQADPNVYKNGMGVFVPGTGLAGLHIAAALGAVGGNAELGLEVFRDATESDCVEMKQLIDDNKVMITAVGEPGFLHIIAEVTTDQGVGVAEIAGLHDHLVTLKVNNKILIQEPFVAKEVKDEHKTFVFSHTVKEIVETIATYSEDELAFLLIGAEMNYKISLAGLENEYGLGIGTKYSRLMNKGIMGKDIVNIVTMYAAAASDARMHGCPLPVMSTNGSGNQGITASVAIYVAAKELGVPRIKLLRALAISHALTIFVKTHMGRLSALCACTIAASTGVCCGLLHLLDAGPQQMSMAIKNTTADLTGVICDGAKLGCALKLATGVSTAAQIALLVTEGMEVPATDGIVAETPEECIRNIGAISNPGMVETDKVILQVMMDKNHCCCSDKE